LSEKTPVAVNCWSVPRATAGLDGVTLIETSWTPVTVRVVEPEIPSMAAVIVAEPGPLEVASPMNPKALLIVAMEEPDEFQVTDCVRSWVELSEKTKVLAPGAASEYSIFHRQVKYFSRQKTGIGSCD
jgi:hypothetical protein